MPQFSCSVVIPVYRGAETIVPLVEQLLSVLPGCTTEHEIILVNDSSPDNSWALIQDLSRKHPTVRGIHLMRNFGQHNATLCGLRAARREVVVTMDDDLQHPPDQIPRLLDELAKGHDVVYGVWRQREHSWWRARLAAFIRRAVAFVMATKTVRDITSFRAIRTSVREAFTGFERSDVLLDVLLSWGTTRFGTVTVDEQPRAAGESNYTFWKLVGVALLVLTSYTTAPLRLASLLGLGFTAFGAVAFGYVLFVYFALGSVPGFSFLAASILMFAGVQLFCLGIIGEYLARVFERTAGRPPYVVSEQIGGEPRP